jgi:sRNA-binding carbon storage regulator CsrA
MIKKFEVTDKYAADIMPRVKISAGNNGSIHAVRMVIEAPRSIPIERGKVRRRKEQEQREVK